MNGVPLSAVALAFLAGYGIDGAFGFLDAVINRVRKIGLDQIGVGSSTVASAASRRTVAAQH